MLILIVICLTVRSYYLSITIIPNYESILVKKLDTQIAIISRFLDETRANADKLASDPAILDYLEKVANNGVDKKYEQTFLEQTTKQKENFGFKSLSLIDNKGLVVFSTNDLLKNINLKNEAYSNNPLFRSYHVAYLTLTPDFSDVLYSTIIKTAAFYLTMPLIKEDKILGTLVCQINEDKITEITQDYLDLGETGEILVAAQTADEAHFITPIRSNPSIKFTTKKLFAENDNMPIQRAARGERGSGVDVDVLGIKTLATWGYIPRVDWGIVVKINLDEVLNPLHKNNKYLVIFAILALICSIAVIFWYSQTHPGSLAIKGFQFFEKIPAPLRHPIFIFLIVFANLSIISFFQYREAYSSALEKSQHDAKTQIQSGIDEIESRLDKISNLADFIAQDLQTERLISEDISKRLRREIVETDGLVRIIIAYAPYEYDESQKLYAASIVQKGSSIIEEKINNEYDYTDKKEGTQKTLWYLKAYNSKKPQWLNPSVDPLTGDNVIIYSMPFFFGSENSAPAGIISISYKLDSFASIARSIGVGPTGYTFIISHDGTFIYHPIAKNFLSAKTLLQFAQEEGNDALAAIAQKIGQEDALLVEFYNKTTDNMQWIYSHSIPLSSWTIATVFSPKETGLPLKSVRKYFFTSATYFMITLLLLLALYCIFCTNNPRMIFFNFANVILIATLFFLWYSIISTSRIERPNQVLITDQASLNRFMNKWKEEAKRKNEPAPVFIPCGIELYSLQQSNPKSVSFSGYIWHKYHKELHQGIARIMRIPQAISINILNQTEEKEGDWEIIGMNFSATIYHELDYSHYPFEEHNISIPFEHGDLTSNMVLIPDLDAYASINPRKLPGLDTTFSLSSFYATETFFNYMPFFPNSDLGVRLVLQLTNEYRLAFNAILATDLFVPIILFCLPLLVILITIFSIFMLEQKKTDPYSMIGPFSGLFFALILLHRSLHEFAPANHILYLEYAFFYTYIIIILFVIHAMLVRIFGDDYTYQDKVVPCVKIIYWPVQILLWIITTLVIFY